MVGGVATLLYFQAASVVAQEGETKSPFSFWVSQTFSRDSNIYRLPDDYPDVPGGKRSDTFSTTRVGVDFDSEVSRQAFHAGLALGRTLYSSHSDLNNTSGDARLRWDWQVGDHLSGILGVSFNESSVGYDNTYTGANTVERERLMRQLLRFNINADYWWHPDWATGFGYSGVRSDYRNDARPYDEYRAQEASLNFTYRPSTGNRIVLGFIWEDGEYPNRKKKEELSPGELSLRDWNRFDVRLSGQWRLTGATRLNGYAGYTKRKYDLAPNRNFSGPTAKIAFLWTPTGKAILDLSWRREVGADQDMISNYAVSQGWSFRPTWVATSKIRFGASYDYMDRNYRGDPGYLPAGLSNPKNARTQSYGLNVQYMPISNASVGLNFQDTRRDAAAKYYEYRARMMWLSGNITF
ncbi:MAG: hypothetical protein FWF12_01420 [Betaproteobacteria bacterium]|nr:hypothetical protein [Betaproteobacteria bacterium]